ncbi:MAG: hypothetical protein WA771_12290 [Chthoniobacterales bacterium]
MKKRLLLAIVSVAVTVLTAQPSFAGKDFQQPGKIVLDKLGETTALKTTSDWENLEAGDMLVADCPMMGYVTVTHVKNPTGKGAGYWAKHQKFVNPGCEITLAKSEDSDEVQATMYCPDAGKEVPVECSVMKAS